ncbi:hypothetical protein M1555_02325 [Patescibacteria group bacterium]|nr:hypothetical protein [Patescibacteria group bacterium]
METVAAEIIGTPGWAETLGRMTAWNLQQSTCAEVSLRADVEEFFYILAWSLPLIRSDPVLSRAFTSGAGGLFESLGYFP